MLFAHSSPLDLQLTFVVLLSAVKLKVSRRDAYILELAAASLLLMFHFDRGCAPDDLLVHVGINRYLECDLEPSATYNLIRMKGSDP